MKSKNKKVPAAGMSWRIAKRVCERLAGVYPFVAAFYLLCLFISSSFKGWRGFFNWPAMNVLMALFSLAAVIGWRGLASGVKRPLYAKTLAAAILVAAALAAKVDPYSFLILLFGIGTVIYRSIHPKYALAAGGLLLASVPLLESIGKEYLSLSVTVCALYFLAILVFGALAGLYEARSHSGTRQLPPAGTRQLPPA